MIAMTEDWFVDPKLTSATGNAPPIPCRGRARRHCSGLKKIVSGAVAHSTSGARGIADLFLLFRIDRHE